MIIKIIKLEVINTSNIAEMKIFNIAQTCFMSFNELNHLILKYDQTLVTIKLI